MVVACETRAMSDEPPAKMSAPVVAAFDLDGTLTEGGSVFHWLRHIAGSREAYAAALRLAVPLTVGALRSGSSADRAKERLFRAVLDGRDGEEVALRSRDFVIEHLLRKGRSSTLERLSTHRTLGHDVVVVSASPQLYVDVVAEELGAQGGLGTRLAVDPLGKLTGGYLGRNCRGSEKVRRLHEWIEERNYERAPVLYAYGNSRGDQRMLRESTHPHDVGKLGSWGALRRFPRLATSPLITDE